MYSLVTTDNSVFKVFLVSRSTCRYHVFSSGNLNNLTNVIYSMESASGGFRLPYYLVHIKTELPLIEFIENNYDIGVTSIKNYTTVEGLIEDLNKFVISEELSR